MVWAFMDALLHMLAMAIAEIVAVNCRHMSHKRLVLQITAQSKQSIVDRLAGLV